MIINAEERCEISSFLHINDNFTGAQSELLFSKLETQKSVLIFVQDLEPELH